MGAGQHQRVCIYKWTIYISVTLQFMERLNKVTNGQAAMAHDLNDFFNRRYETSSPFSHLSKDTRKSFQIADHVRPLCEFLYGNSDPDPAELKQFDAFFSCVPEGEVRDLDDLQKVISASPLGRGFQADFNGLDSLCCDLIKKNRKGWHVYHLFKRRDILAFDDLPREDLGALEATGINPNVLIKTSPSNYQGIIRLPQGMDGVHSSENGFRNLRRAFTDKFGTDASQADWKDRQSLRVPGFFNIASKHFFNGGFPLVSMERCDPNLNSPGLMHLL